MNQTNENQDFLELLKESDYGPKGSLCWPTNYAEYSDDKKLVLKKLFFCKSTKDFLLSYPVSDYLTEQVSDWSFSTLVKSFIYHYTVDFLQSNNYLLTEYFWYKILNFTLNPACGSTSLNFIKKNKLTNFSKKQSVIDGGVLSLQSYLIILNLEKPLPDDFDKELLDDFFQFLQVPQKDIKILKNSIFIDKDKIKVLKYLQNHKWLDKQINSLQKATIFVKNLISKKKRITIDFNKFLDIQLKELEDFQPIDILSSSEDSTNKIFTFTLFESYFSLFSDFLINPGKPLLKIFSDFDFYLKDNSYSILLSKYPTKVSREAFNKNPKDWVIIEPKNLLHDLGLYKYEKVEEKYQDDQLKLLDKNVQNFLKEANNFFLEEGNIEKKDDLSLIIQTPLIEEIKDITKNVVYNSKVVLFLVTFIALLMRSSVRARKDFEKLQNPSTKTATVMISPFASAPFASITGRATQRVLRQNLTEPASVNKLEVTASQRSNEIQERTLKRKGAQQNAFVLSQNRTSDAPPSFKQLPKVQRQSLLLPEQPSLYIPASTDIALVQQLNTLVFEVNNHIRALNNNGQTIHCELTCIKDRDGRLTGEVTLIGSTGIQRSNNSIRSEISKIINQKELTLLKYNNFKNEGDHFLTATTRQGGKLISRVDTAGTLMTFPAHHQVLTNWAPEIFSREDGKGGVISELSYAEGITIDRWIDYMKESKKIATKEFLENFYLVDINESSSSKVCIKVPKDTPNAVNGSTVLEMFGYSDEMALNAQEKSANLARVQLKDKLSANGQNSQEEQVMILDSRILMNGHRQSCQNFLSAQSNKEGVEKNYSDLAIYHKEHLFQIEKAIKNCKPGSPAESELQVIKSRVEQEFVCTIQEAEYSLNNFEFTEAKKDVGKRAVYPKDMSKNAMDQEALNLGVLKQDKNYTVNTFNKRTTQVKDFSNFKGFNQGDIKIEQKK